MTRRQLETLIEAVLEESTNLASEIHGPQHWRCVSWVGIELARATPGADPLVAFLFGLFHDSMRESDAEDKGHGERGAELALILRERNLMPITEDQFEKMAYACATHTEAEPCLDPVVGCCYDGDRLNLWRVRIRPEVRYLSTELGKRMALAKTTQRRHDERLEWSEVLNLLFASHLVGTSRNI